MTGTKSRSSCLVTRSEYQVPYNIFIEKLKCQSKTIGIKIEVNLVFLYKYQYIRTKVSSNMKEPLYMSKDNLQDAAKSCNGCNGNMRERLLIKCDTTIFADEITNLLIENNIVSRQHDEEQDQRPGAYGAITGIAIYVFEKDYEKAVEITNPIVGSRNKSQIWCPKCGSYNVSAICVSNKYGTAIALLCIFLVLIPGLYLAWANDLGIKSTIADYIALSMLISFLVIAFFGKISNANYICKDCNKKFRHK